MSKLRRRAFLAGGLSLAPGLLSLEAPGGPRAASTDASADKTLSVRPASAGSTEGLGATDLLAPDHLVSAWGLDAGQQLRLRRNADQFAAFTIETGAGAVSNNSIRLTQEGLARLGTQDTFEATVTSPVPHPGHPPSVAAREGEYVETLHDPGGSRLVVAAPHGGRIEPYTDRQAERVVERLPGTVAWTGRGWQPGGGSFDRWHVPSTEIHPESYPALGRIADRGFGTAVSFHGFTGDGIRIGGAAPAPLVREVRAALDDAVGDVLDVRRATRDAYLGSDPDNVVNWLTANGSNGVQLEQGFEARSDYWQSIADAVAGVFA